MIYTVLLNTETWTKFVPHNADGRPLDLIEIPRMVDFDSIIFG
jgi:hypothetical protein